MGALVFTALAQDADVPAEGERVRRRAGNADQARRRMMGRRGQMISLNTPGLNAVDDLTDDQKKEIAAIRKAAMEKMQALKKQMDADVMAQLTPEQRAKAVEAAKRAAARRGGVTLTDDQKAILDAARKAAAEEDDREAKMKIMREAMQKIRESYTDEQKKQAAERRRRFGGGNRERRRRVERNRDGDAPKEE